MGRYISFNSGVEYKLVFGVQENQDIDYYGGHHVFNEEEGTFDTMWLESDIQFVEQRLMEMEYAYLFDRPTLMNYAKNADGTQGLKHDFWNKYDYYKIDKIKARYLLGLILYHQLSYTCPLVAKWDI
jgi:hypothetical protein